MVTSNVSAASASVDLFSMVTNSALRDLGAHAAGAFKPTGAMHGEHDVRSPMHCKYPSKKCWNLRVEKRNGELHKFCEYHRQKANSNQRRMEQRRKQQRMLQMNGAQAPVGGAQDVSMDGAMNSKAASPSSVAMHPYRTPGFDLPVFAAQHQDMCMDVPFTPSEMVEFDVGYDAAIDCMMIDDEIDLEPSDRPVDLYEADLFFLEHFRKEITQSGF